MKLKLMNKSLEFLRDTLAAPGWNKGDNQTEKIKRIYQAGKLLADVLPEPPKPIIPPIGVTLLSEAGQKYKSDVTAWNKAFDTPEFELPIDLFDVCAFALKNLISEPDKFPSGPNTNELIDTFKLLT